MMYVWYKNSNQCNTQIHMLDFFQAIVKTEFIVENIYILKY